MLTDALLDFLLWKIVSHFSTNNVVIYGSSVFNLLSDNLNTLSEPDNIISEAKKRSSMWKSDVNCQYHLFVVNTGFHWILCIVYKPYERDKSIPFMYIIDTITKYNTDDYIPFFKTLACYMLFHKFGNDIPRSEFIDWFKIFNCRYFKVLSCDTQTDTKSCGFRVLLNIIRFLSSDNTTCNLTFTNDPFITADGIEKCMQLMKDTIYLAYSEAVS